MPSFSVRENDSSDEDEDTPRRPRKHAGTQKASVRKQSFESSADVQRWLREQAVETEGAIDSPFQPTLLAGRRDSDWVMSSLAQFYTQGLITDVVAMASSGKEATVYCCSTGFDGREPYLAAKIYRPRMFRNLKNDAIYRRNRMQRDPEGHALRNPRRRPGEKSQRVRNLQVSNWIAYEYETQALLYAAGADVPRPVALAGNGVLMEFIGEELHAAPRLHDVALDPDDAPRLFERLVSNLEIWLRCHRIHGDLSPYNILVQDGRLVIIDFAQAVDPRYATDVFDLLERDVERICACFSHYGLRTEPRRIADDLWLRYSIDQIWANRVSTVRHECAILPCEASGRTRKDFHDAQDGSYQGSGRKGQFDSEGHIGGAGCRAECDHGRTRQGRECHPDRVWHV